MKAAEVMEVMEVMGALTGGFSLWPVGQLASSQ
jgi:hypothetical protein